MEKILINLSNTPIPHTMIHPISSSTIHSIVDQFHEVPYQTKSSDYWEQYLKTGTSLWLDTGDMDAIKSIWSSEFSALTTNNSLLNNEVQRGIYDNIIPELVKKISYLNCQDRIKEIAFCLNAIHGLRLAKMFNCKVSVELHTDLAHDINGIYIFGKRLFDICPKQFIIKVPFTAAGLLGARQLHESGVPVNFTLDFSVRQNVMAAIVAQPAYSNVFIGRLGAYLKNNKLGEGLYIGEKVSLETQHCLRQINKKGLSMCKLIIASIRNTSQLNSLIGTDTFTIPSKIANEAIENKQVIEHQHLNKIPEPVLFEEENKKKLRLKHLWQVQDYEKTAILHFNEKRPSSEDELIEYMHEQGCHDLFPNLSESDHHHLKSDGKIPIHSKWAKKIADAEIGIDTLLNLAGLYAFSKDQAQLDERIRSIV